jgi:acyl carrier protein
MSVVTADQVRRFILSHLAGSLRDNGVSEDEVGDDFDLMRRGIIDSIGLIHLISAIGEHFGIEVDFEGMDTDSITVIGPVCAYIESRARKESNDA